ncbi:MAG: hypothetical protein VB089_20960 [Anaerolineaceae bacterium]|nr:hypothetical protein [Anaerolineaceae bacterium]
MLQGLMFVDRDNFTGVRVFTYRMPEGSSLGQVVQDYFAYDEREFKPDYAPMQLAGRPAYGFVNRWHQDYNGCTIFFEHADEYTVIELKILSPAKLDVDWQIIRSIQAPGSAPAENVIPDQLVADSYRLL